MDSKTTTFPLEELAKYINAKVSGSVQIQINGVGSLQNAQEGQISFLADNRYRHLLASTNASAVIMEPVNKVDCHLPMLLCDNPKLAFSRICDFFPINKRPKIGIHKSAIIADSCILEEGISIGPGVVIGENSVIGKSCIIGPNCTIGNDCVIGNDCQLKANVVLSYRTRLGKGVIIHPGAVIGADGFGLISDNEGNWVKVPQRGCVVLGNFVEIGANTTIDRGALEDTVLENDVRIDNLVQIAHNVHIGEHTAIAALAGIAGSTKIGARCKIGGDVAIIGHISICDDVRIAATSSVAESLTRSGFHGPNNSGFLHRRIDRLRKKLNHLQKMTNAEYRRIKK